MSWSDPCNKCGFHRADCECHKNKPSVYLVDEVEQFPWHNRKDFRETYDKWMKVRPESLKYLETLPKAYEIYEKLFGEPKTHKEWAERFNKVGEINRILMNKQDKNENL
jgi:hypothetical protein